jgi:hypothetical protein
VSGTVPEPAPVPPPPGRALRWGGILMVAGILLTAAGGITTAVTQTTQIALAADRAEIPDPLTFDATASGYRIILLADPLIVRRPFINNPQAQFLCDVERADGTTTQIDTGTSAVRTETDLGIELGEFDATRGSTTVTCHWKDDRESSGYFYSVAPSSSLVETIALVVLIAGLLTLAVAILLTIRGYMVRLRNVRPIPPSAT